MKQFAKAALAVLILFAAAVSVNAQSNVIVTKENISKNHTGTISGASNTSGSLFYEWVYDRTDQVSYPWDDGSSTRGSIYYTLNIYTDASKKSLVISAPVKMRNLITTYYVDVTFTKDDYAKSAAAIFKKDTRWARIKYVPHPGCQREDGTWDRIDRVESFEQLLEYIVSELDENIDFSCYN